ncbi:MAG: hypothetical protein ACLFPB_01150 [Desulfovermiculus sp.]
MKDFSLRTGPGHPSPPSSSHFVCPEESAFYALCLQHLVFAPQEHTSFVEFGSGDGKPVIAAIKKSSFAGKVTGWEISVPSAARAKHNIEIAGLGSQYTIQKSCFFASAREYAPQACLIANPPYVPAFDAQELLMPELWGGPDGDRILRSLFDLDFCSLLLLIPSISNPVQVIRYGLDQGYFVHQYMAITLPFGTYTSQSSVQARLREMQSQKISFFFSSHYLLAGVYMSKRSPPVSGRNESLLQIMTAGKT